VEKGQKIKIRRDNKKHETGPTVLCAIKKRVFCDFFAVVVKKKSRIVIRNKSVVHEVKTRVCV
jgi:hypothetical protein